MQPSVRGEGWGSAQFFFFFFPFFLRVSPSFQQSQPIPPPPKGKCACSMCLRGVAAWQQKGQEGREGRRVAGGGGVCKSASVTSTEKGGMGLESAVWCR